MKKNNEHACAQVSSMLLKKFQKPHMKVADVKKTGIELKMIVGNRDQGVDIIK